MVVNAAVEPLTKSDATPREIFRAGGIPYLGGDIDDVAEARGVLSVMVEARRIVTLVLSNVRFGADKN